MVGGAIRDIVGKIWDREIRAWRPRLLKRFDLTGAGFRASRPKIYDTLTPLFPLFGTLPSRMPNLQPDFVSPLTRFMAIDVIFLTI